MKKSLLSCTVLGVALTAAPFLCAARGPRVSESSSDIPLTTTSDEARRSFRGGLENIENQQSQRAHVDFRSAVRADADFALAHLFLVYDSGNPTEEAAELAKAKALGANASKPEQLLITWLAGARNGEYVTAISAMNDLLADYPRDKFLLFLAGRWMVQQRNYDGAQQFLQRAVAIQPNYPAALNELAYAYAFTGDFKKAFETLDKYEQASPGEPNTEDSYGEISRMAGKYEQAIEHYTKALQFDSNFVWSRVGLGDTYMLMGKQVQARAEYAKAIAVATSPGDRLTWEIASALTYAYANDSKSFVQVMQGIADEAHAGHVSAQEATAYRDIAMYLREPKETLEYARKAEEAITHSKDVSATDADQQLALTWRTEAVAYQGMGDAHAAQEVLERMAQRAQQSRSEFVRLCGEGATGAILLARRNFKEAVPHLEEDSHNTLSAAWLVRAYRGAGEKQEADDLQSKIDRFHEPTIDDLLARRFLTEPRTKK
jgi:tetratricopeptide (TPR) repeat protein